MENETTQGRVLDATSLKALAHPMRIRILDILGAFGPQTASSLATRLGESSGATSYHLRALAKHDLIREDTERGTARERWWTSAREKWILGAEEATDTPAKRATAQMVANEMYRQYDENLHRYLDSIDGRTSEHTLTTSKINLTPEQYEQFSTRLEAMIDEIVDAGSRTPVPGARPYSIRMDMFPLGPTFEGDRS